MEDRRYCEECGQNMSNDAIWGLEVRKGIKPEYHYFCSEEHGNTWAEKQPYKLITSENVN